MKIKAKKTFISGVYFARAGDILKVSDRRAARLIALDFAKPAEKGQTAPQSDGTETDGEIPAPKKKAARTAKTAAKSAG